ALHCFDSDVITAPNHPVSRPQIQISIDRPAPTKAAPTKAATRIERTAQSDLPIFLPMGNLRYSYKVKPLVSSKATSNRL
ncbi:MAG TPA: hypothetical protein VKR41_06425, partial [Puia sp.]|nr:hypothetical protein [Puia sp.]